MKHFSFSLFLLGSVLATDPTVYLIRHGEKPTDGGAGLSPEGEQRALCLTSVFGPDSDYDIGYIIAEEYEAGTSDFSLSFFFFLPHRSPFLIHWLYSKTDGSRDRPYLTVLPLADELNLTINDSCSKKDATCVADLVTNYTGSGNVLICWEHKQPNNIAEALGASSVSNYPSDE